MATKKPKDIPEGQTLGQYWHSQLEHAQKVFDKWETRAKKVVKRYRDERDATENQRKKFNILWSNIQILQPSLYGRAAKPEVSRRYSDQDQAGRLASTMLERSLEYETDQFPDFDAAMSGCVEDRLLPGRGTAWVRYAPNIVKDEPQTPDQEVAQEGAQITDKTEDVPLERVDSAHSPVDYVYWMDFLHSPARTWAEVWWVSRWVYMTKDEGVERFGKVFNNVPIDSEEPVKEWQDNAAKTASRDKKAKVAEIWDKRTGKVIWVAKGYPQELDVRDDPLQLEEFFPTPKPLFATMTNGSMIPVPDYCEYEDQAAELDSITNRISLMVKACKAVGVFNAEFKELARLLNEGVDNKLFPVTAWAALAEKGGLRGSVDMLDITTVITALQELYKARDACKQTIYETMGLSDIIRGASAASETLGAQKIKAQFGSLRLRNSQGDVARFATDIFRIKAQLICRFYPPEVIVEMSGVMQTADGQDPQLLQQAVQILKDAKIRDFHINIEADTLAQIDEAAEKEEATEVTHAISGFLKEALPVAQQAPEMLPVIGDILLFTLRRFRAGRTLEGSIEQAMKALQAKAQQMAAQPKPNPEMAKIQASQQNAQAKIAADTQSEQQRLSFDAQRIQMESAAKERESQMQAGFDARQNASDARLEWAIAQLNARAKVDVAETAAGAVINTAQSGAARDATQ
jgi:hypothetical protein